MMGKDSYSIFAPGYAWEWEMPSELTCRLSQKVAGRAQESPFPHPSKSFAVPGLGIFESWQSP